MAHCSEQITSPAWHGEVLSARKARVDAGKGRFLTVEEVRSRLHGTSGPK